MNNHCYKSFPTFKALSNKDDLFSKFILETLGKKSTHSLKEFIFVTPKHTCVKNGNIHKSTYFERY